MSGMQKPNAGSTRAICYTDCCIAHFNGAHVGHDLGLASYVEKHASAFVN